MCIELGKTNALEQVMEELTEMAMLAEANGQHSKLEIYEIILTKLETDYQKYGQIVPFPNRV